MPKKKANGYFMFMQQERKRIQAETKQVPSMQEMATLCNEAWKKLSPADRATYNSMAKGANVKGGAQDPDLFRMDNQRQIIAHRKSAALEAAGKRIREKQLLVKSWEGKDILDLPFHFINFQVMYTEEPIDDYLPLEVGLVSLTLRDGITKHMHSFIDGGEVPQGNMHLALKYNILDLPFHFINFQVMYTEEPIDDYLPLEVGLVSLTLRDGITKHMHSFIDGGEVPQGNMHLALKYSENTHKIPLDFEQADRDFLGLWTRIEKFVVDDPRRDDVPPIFCLANESTMVESCLDYIHYHARSGEPNIFIKVYALEDLVMSLLLQSGKFTVKPSETQIHDSLLRNQWDHVGSIKCSYHDTADCCHCSLAIVKRLSFAMFDMLSGVLDFKLGDGHMPDESSNQTFTVKLPSSAGSRPATRDGRNTWHETTRSRSPSPPAYRSALAEQRDGKWWSAPKNSRVQVSFSSGEEDDYDDDDIEIKSSDQYVLKELRKPNNNPMLPLVMGSGFGRGLSLPQNIATPEESQNQVGCPPSIRPPPGFGPRPGFPVDSLLRPQAMMRSAPDSCQVRAPVTPWFSLPNQGHVLEVGRGRGRGLPPQVPPVLPFRGGRV